MCSFYAAMKIASSGLSRQLTICLHLFLGFAKITAYLFFRKMDAKVCNSNVILLPGRDKLELVVE